MPEYAERGGGPDRNPIWADIGRGLAKRYEAYLNCPLPEHLTQLLRKLDAEQPEELGLSGPGFLHNPDAASEEA